MPPLATLARTGAFAWGTSAAHLPILATGTASGALDDSFDQGGRLELWSVYGTDSSLPSPSAALTEAPQSPVAAKKKSSRKESVAAGADLDFGEEGDDEDGFLAEVSLTGHGEAGKREPVRSFKVKSRFSKLAWSAPISGRPRGVLAAGMEDGELVVYDPEKLLAGSSLEEATIFQQVKHKGPIRALDFSLGKKQLLASGSSDGEIFIWDTTTLSSASTAYSPGPISKPGDVTALAWNCQKEFILASALSTGHTIIWDLRTKTQIKTLTYAAPGLGGGGPGGNGGRGAVSSVCWHPEDPTTIITASEDDAAPVIMLWSLRNALAPEAILSGHDKGVLSLSWCRQDPNLLLSSGKDNRTILWNPLTKEFLGEYPVNNNWTFQTSFYPRNPDLFATASFDGKVNVFSLQSSGSSEGSSSSTADQTAEAEDLFDNPAFLASSTDGGFSLKQPPRWLRRPVSATFGFGGTLASTSNLAAASGKHQSATVHLRTVVTETELIDRVQKLQTAKQSKDGLSSLCEERSRLAEAAEGGRDVAGWRALSSLFTANSRSELVSLLGFSQQEVADKVAVAINKFKKDHGKDDSNVAVEPPSTVVTSAEGVTSELAGELGVATLSLSEESTVSGGADEVAGSEASAGGFSDATKKAEGESEPTEPSSSLFSDEEVGTPQTDAAPDFFSSMGTLRSALPSHVLVPHQPQRAESSAAATVGSAPSLAASENLKVATFKIYPSDESEVDNLITRALVLGDFESAVSLCLSAERFADAILLAVRGGPELLAKTQKTYFERRTESLPYLRLFQSIVSDDLSDVVQNADLSEWQEIFVVLCTFAKADEFNGLAEQLGQRLEHQYRVAATSEVADLAGRAKEYRRHATLCFLAAKKLEKVVNIWADEMKEEENAIEQASASHSRYAAHAQALQSFMEKVTVFQSATDYVDKELASPTESEAVADSGARSYKLASLYERYFEYADLLATQGLVQDAAQYIQLTPADFKLDGDAAGPSAARERFLTGASISTATAGPSTIAVAAPSTYQPAGSSVAAASANPVYANQARAAPPPPQAPSAGFKPSHKSRTGRASISIDGSSPFVAVSASTPPATLPAPQTQQLYTPYQPTNAYGNPASQTQPAGSYGAGPYGQPAYAQSGSVSVPPPPRLVGTPSSDHLPPPPLPAAARRDIPGWNDAPPTKAGSNIVRPTSAASKVGAITSPFPNSPGIAPPPMSPSVHGHAHQQQQSNGFFPPPRGSTPQTAAPPPPPPRAGSNMRPAPPAATPPPPRAAPPPAGRPAPPPAGRAPPPRVTSPLAGGVPSTIGMQAPAPAPPSADPGRYAPLPGSQPSPAAPAGFQQPPVAKAAPPPPPPAPVVEPKHPAGDRTHIPAANIPIFEQIQFLFEYVRSLPPPSPQIAQELQRMPAKLDILFDRLNNDAVSEDLASKLREIAKSMENRRLDEAYPFLLSFIPNTAFDGLLPAITSLKLLMSIAMSPPQ